MWHIINEITDIDRPIRVVVSTLTVFLVLGPLAYISLARSPEHLAGTRNSVGVELSLVLRAIVEKDLTCTLMLVEEKLA